jgi:hypothetical protein
VGRGRRNGADLYGLRVEGRVVTVVWSKLADAENEVSQHPKRV